MVIPFDERPLSVFVHQASGMVSVQLDCTPHEALEKMAERANETGLTVEAIAAEVLAHEILFDPATTV